MVLSTLAMVAMLKLTCLLLLCHMVGEQKEAARQELEIKVRGKGCPPLVNTWEQCGFSERVLSVIRRNQFKVNEVYFFTTSCFTVLYCTVL